MYVWYAMHKYHVHEHVQLKKNTSTKQHEIYICLETPRDLVSSIGIIERI